jgi:hypothetical protein
MSNQNNINLLMTKLDAIPSGADKEEALKLSGIMTSSNKSMENKSDALTRLEEIFKKHGIASFFNANGSRQGGKRTRRALRKKRANRKTRRHQ